MPSRGGVAARVAVGVDGRRSTVDGRLGAPRARGFTLLEVTVSLGILAMLALMLAGLLRQAVAVWHDGEARRDVHDEAQAVLETLARDIENTLAVTGPRPGGGKAPVDVRFLCDRDAMGRQRLRLVRALAGEDADARTRDAGAGSPSAGYTEYRDGREDAARKLRPLLGMLEVAYASSPEAGATTLYRCERAPPGGAGSLFTPAALESKAALESRGLPVSTAVLLCRFHFWSHRTTTWDSGTPPALTPGEAGGPLTFWDSTRGVLAAPAGRGKRPAPEGDFAYAVGPTSVDDPVDDLWPAMVRITLVVAGRGVTAHESGLSGTIGAQDDTLAVEDPTRFPEEPGPGAARLVVRVDDEWMEYGQRTSTGLRSVKRGLFGTTPAEHGDGTLVRGGTLFYRTVAIPARRGYDR